MPENSICNYSGTCNSLADRLRELDMQINVSEKNRQLKIAYEDKVRVAEGNVSVCSHLIEYLKPMVQDAQDYIAKRREESMQHINNALRMSGEIIPESSDGVYFKQDGDEAYLVTSDGLLVDMTDGGGFRQTSSVFISNVILDTLQSNITSMFLDEMFSWVSVDNSVTLSLYLNALAQSSQLICIEQKPEVFCNVNHVQYKFTKNGNYTSVSRSMYVAGENNA